MLGAVSDVPAPCGRSCLWEPHCLPPSLSCLLPGPSSSHAPSPSCLLSTRLQASQRNPKSPKLIEVVLRSPHGAAFYVVSVLAWRFYFPIASPKSKRSQGQGRNSADGLAASRSSPASPCPFKTGPVLKGIFRAPLRA